MKRWRWCAWRPDKTPDEKQAFLDDCDRIYRETMAKMRVGQSGRLEVAKIPPGNGYWPIGFNGDDPNATGNQC